MNGNLNSPEDWEASDHITKLKEGIGKGKDGLPIQCLTPHTQIVDRLDDHARADMWIIRHMDRQNPRPILKTDRQPRMVAKFLGWSFAGFDAKDIMGILAMIVIIGFVWNTHSRLTQQKKDLDVQEQKVKTELLQRPTFTTEQIDGLIKAIQGHHEQGGGQ